MSGFVFAPPDEEPLSEGLENLFVSPVQPTGAVSQATRVPRRARGKRKGGTTLTSRGTSPESDVMEEDASVPEVSQGAPLETSVPEAASLESIVEATIRVPEVSEAAPVSFVRSPPPVPKMPVRIGRSMCQLHAKGEVSVENVPFPVWDMIFAHVDEGTLVNLRKACKYLYHRIGEALKKWGQKNLNCEEVSAVIAWLHFGDMKFSRAQAQKEFGVEGSGKSRTAALISVATTKYGSMETVALRRRGRQYVLHSFSNEHAEFLCLRSDFQAALSYQIFWQPLLQELERVVGTLERLQRVFNCRALYTPTGHFLSGKSGVAELLSVLLRMKLGLAKQVVDDAFVDSFLCHVDNEFALMARWQEVEEVRLKVSHVFTERGVEQSSSYADVVGHALQSLSEEEFQHRMELVEEDIADEKLRMADAAVIVDAFELRGKVDVSRRAFETGSLTILAFLEICMSSKAMMPNESMGTVPRQLVRAFEKDRPKFHALITTVFEERSDAFEAFLAENPTFQVPPFLKQRLCLKYQLRDDSPTLEQMTRMLEHVQKGAVCECLGAYASEKCEMCRRCCAKKSPTNEWCDGHKQ